MSIRLKTSRASPGPGSPGAVDPVARPFAIDSRLVDRRPIHPSWLSLRRDLKEPRHSSGADVDDKHRNSLAAMAE
jgi:hypothetical protein